MPLKSLIFAGNDRLQACLVNDAAHITPGSTGEHVQLIQLALGLVDGWQIDEIEFESMLYGETTTAAVLAYKRKRKIINHNYQQTEDNIVGKMTIESLDTDMCVVEETEVTRTRALRQICQRHGHASRLRYQPSLPSLPQATLLAIRETLGKRSIG